MVGSINLQTFIEAIETIVPDVLLAYACYWGLSIRRALAIRLYRNQAMGIGLISATFGLVTTFTYASNGTTFELAPLFVAVMFYWIDASVLASRRTDPLLRDTIHWKRIRIGLWAVLDVLIAGYFAALIYSLATGTLSPFLYIDPLIILIPFVSAIVTLPIVSRRSKDTSLRRHLKWFALFGACALVGILVTFLLGYISGTTIATPPSLYTNTPIMAGATIGGYCLYRSAKSLVPLNRISLEEVKSG